MSRRALPTLVGLVIVAALLPLGVQAAADEWRAPALVPQRFGWRGVDAVLNDPLLPRAVLNSTLVAVLTVVLAVVIGWPAARALATTERPGRYAVLIAAPLLVPALVVGDGLSTWFLRLGLADHLFGVALAHLVYVLPYVVLALTPAFTPAVLGAEEAARTLGASRGQRIVTVTLPGVRAGLGLAIALGFTVSWSQFGTSLGVGGGLPMLPLVLVPFVRSDPQIAAVLDLVFLVPPLVVLAVASRVRFLAPPAPAIPHARRMLRDAHGPLDARRLPVVAPIAEGRASKVV